jgi:hypothetical protein
LTVEERETDGWSSPSGDGKRDERRRSERRLAMGFSRESCRTWQWKDAAAENDVFPELPRGPRRARDVADGRRRGNTKGDVRPATGNCGTPAKTGDFPEERAGGLGTGSPEERPRDG